MLIYIYYQVEKNYEPEECCFEFLGDRKILSVLKEFGKLDETRASALKTAAQGLGLSYGFIGEESDFSITTKDKTGMHEYICTLLLKVL